MQREQTRQHARIIDGWVEEVGLDPAGYRANNEAHKASLIYRRTRNLRAVQLLLGHTKLESTVHYLGIEIDDDRLLAIVEAGVKRKSEWRGC